MLAALVSRVLADPSSPSVDYSVLGNYGVVGLVAAAGIAFGWSTIVRERKKTDVAQEEVKRLNDFIATQVVPALVEATRAANDAIAMLRGKGSG